MKTKRIFPLLSFATVIAAASSNLISINIGDKTGHVYLGNLKDFDWNDATYGDGLYYSNNNEKAVIDEKSDIYKSIDNADLCQISSNARGRYIDYSKYRTGFQIKENIEKQAVTGVPLNWGFMPNGNYIKDFGVTSIAEKHRMVNSILDWTPQNDIDSKYNRSYRPLRNSTQTAFVYPKMDKNGNPIKNPDMKFDWLGYSTTHSSTFENTGVGVKNPFEGTNLNWQYTSTFVNWSGSSISGIIAPPPADVIDMAHNNGTPIYGNIFLDGSHGLTAEMLKDFVKRDSKGNFLAVDFLLNIANYEGFDGYFLNDESNGWDPNGTVLDYRDAVEMVKQFNEKSYKNGWNKKILFYDASANVHPGQEDREAMAMTKTMPDNSAQEIALGFGFSPDKNVDFLKEHPNYKRSDLYSLYDGGWRNYIFGSYDWRQLGYKFSLDATTNNRPKYDKNIWGSIAGFMGGGPVNYAQEAFDLLNQTTENKKSNNIARQYIFATQVSNLFNDIFFNGTNMNQDVTDEGLLDGVESGDNGYGPVGVNSNPQFEYVINDPRIGFSDSQRKTMEAETSKIIDDAVKLKIYNYKTNNGRNSHSYGVGNLIKEKTVFEDEDSSDAAIKTNFSTGSGINFIDRDSEGKILSETRDYPYTNRHIADIMPTYQWDINEYDPEKVSQFFSTNIDDSLDSTKPKITNLNGFYDYDDIYRKSNSLAIGSKFDTDGKVQNGIWDKNKEYIWDLMGTNISKDNHVFSLVYKPHDMDHETKTIDAEIKPVLTITNQSNGQSRYVVIPSENITSTTKTKDGWTKVTFDLNNLGINKENRLSRVGLMINTKNDDNFKLNLGEFSMDDKNTLYKGDTSKAILDKFVSEYRIQRDGITNLRFNYKMKEKLDYVEFYLKDKKNKWYRVGETSAEEYYIKNIDEKVFGESMSLAVVGYKDNEIVGSNKYEID